MSNSKKILKALMPQALIDAYRTCLVAREHRRTAVLDTETVFTEIYAHNKWGGKAGEFSSGSGTSRDSVVAPYVAKMRDWLQSVGSDAMTVVDLGCGDFRVGRQLADLCGRYIGVDIVKSLVQHNDSAFGGGRVEFRHLNIIEDPLPEGDICFVRQVLQHLSNDQIASILPKLGQYRWAVITEHQASANRLRRANIDKPHGGGIRVFEGSGVYLDEPPFSIPKARLRLLLEVEGHGFSSGFDPGVIRTFLLTSEAPGD